MRIKLFGVEIQISFLFSALFTALLLFDRTGLFTPLLCSVVLHEAGHLFMMWALDRAPKRIRLIPAAVEITAPANMTLFEEALVAASGPAVNLILTLVFYINAAVFASEVSKTFAAVNLVLALFNLLPVTGLDGGTLLFCFLSRRLSLERTRTIIKCVNLVFAFAALLVAFYTCLSARPNPTLWIMGFYLLAVTLIKL